MNIIIVGLNHKTAPIDIREKFFLSPTQQDLLLSELKSNPSILEAFVLSTCNRTEIYANVLPGKNYLQYFLELIADIKKFKMSDELLGHFYSYTDQQAARHFLRVTSGLDSLVLGEKQILGQVKDSVERAQTRGIFSRSFNILSNAAIRVGKKARTETDISFGGSSVSSAAIVVAKRLLGTLEDKSVLVIGAGKMGELTINQICSKTKAKVYLMNRTQCIADEMAQKYDGISAAFCDIKEILSEVDVCFCSSGAPHYILEKSTVEKVMALRNHRKLVMIDISMPRNIDPEVAQVSNVHLVDIDGLDKVVSENMRKRTRAVADVEHIIDSKLSEFYRKLERLSDSVKESPSLNKLQS